MMLPDLSLYIHIPWCIKKCPYCDFNSHAITKNKIPEDEYIKALINDLINDLPLVQDRKITSIFIGGGTPSLLSPKAYKELLTTISKYVDIAENAEITMEANPATCEHYDLIDYINVGINRISLGIQSFNDNQLKNLGRIHNAADAINVASTLKNQGFSNFNIDIMYGLQQQSCSQALADLQQAIDLKPAHISWYELTIEPNTIFYSKPPILPDDSKVIEMQAQGQELLKQNGFHRYEISAYSSIEKQSRHNLNYWKFGDYIGIGAGAHSKITHKLQNKIARYWKTRMPSNYLQTFSINSIIPTNTGSRILHQEDIIIEFFMNSLRLTKGIDQNIIYQRVNLNYKQLINICSTAIEKKLLTPITTKNTKVCATEKGLLFLNDLISTFS
jgi:oxygen-independent coproporphyrinogen-3 oxidase